MMFLTYFTSIILAIVALAVTKLLSFKDHGLFSQSNEEKLTKETITPLEFLKRRLRAWMYLISGPQIIQAAYEKSNGNPFEVLAPDNRYVFVSSPHHISELNNAPDTTLSLQAASKQMLQPKYTMTGFNWFDRRGTEGVGFIKALRTLLTNDMPSILPGLGSAISENFAKMHAKESIVHGAKGSPIYPMVVQLTVSTNSLAFFGKELASNTKFMKSALDFIEHTLMTAELVRLLPRVLSRPIGQLLASRLSSHQVIYEHLVVITEQRLLEQSQANAGKSIPKHHDCIQYILETAPKKQPWSARRIVHELMAIWFGSVHALSTTVTFTIHDLCLHPEYIAPLRSEVEGPAYNLFEQTARGLPLLDSFIKESARLTPVESMSTRRCALTPFTLSDGTHVGVGDWACTPVRAIMTNPQDYPNPLEFQGFRFVDLASFKEDLSVTLLSEGTRPSNLTDCNNSWHVWGTGRMTCPGRFYAAAVMKVMLANIIKNYDCKLADEKAERWFTWRSNAKSQHLDFGIVNDTLKSLVQGASDIF
ncbi:hypothetical protein HYFRA_00010675 [Hymenoscyphus fraxineus]|uniref:Cytochrome P450 n=1 Tax=Hymenoscyphus fraxineus TaxID=746836 RepID=A0A9N9L7Z6_9HELO|nr:hypothetical protein HYFRA_00010675 [Hymenoscyphus fraxineus]